MFPLIVALALLAFVFYKWATLNNDFFKRRNIKFIKPQFLVGNTGTMFFGTRNVIDYGQMLYQAFPDESIYGIFDFRVPQYFVRSPDAIKQIAVKDFDHFADHQPFVDVSIDNLWGNILLFLQGEKWRHMRATLSPAFTGAKMRQMFELVVECADGVLNHFLKRAKNREEIDVEMKEFFSKYTNDVIGSCAFGLKINSFDEPENKFYLCGKSVMNFSGLKQLSRMFMVNKLPTVAKALKITFSEAKFTNFFRKTIFDTMKLRKNNNISRPDMINTMIQIRDGTFKSQSEEKMQYQDGFATVEESDVGKMSVNHKWNDDEILAQCFIFFIAGFDTTSILLSFATHELATNPDIQQKLYDEIIEMDQQLGGERINYVALQKLKYLDQVICEALRMWPPIPQVNRMCVKDYIYDDGDKFKFQIKKGTTLIISILGIHRDEKYYPEPNKFNPDRFSDENKCNIVPGTYLPFGVGPRNCIGSRFALMVAKAILYNLLLNFSFEPNEKTQIPVKLKKTAYTWVCENGLHLKLKPRNK